MDAGMGMKWSELRQMLATADKIFDMVRLVDPMKTCEVSLSEDGSLVEVGGNCYDFWKHNTKCSNCTSLCSLNLGCSASKNEKVDGCSYHMLSEPI